MGSSRASKNTHNALACGNCEGRPEQPQQQSARQPGAGSASRSTHVQRLARCKPALLTHQAKPLREGLGQPPSPQQAGCRQGGGVHSKLDTAKRGGAA